jgi:glycosyltransferase involved in cell wall biosynthesis
MTKNKQKLLFLIPSFPVISETFIEREIAELYKRETFDIEVMSFKKGADFNYPELSKITNYLKITPKDIFFGKLYFLRKSPSLLLLSFIMAMRNSRGVTTNAYIWLKSIGYAYRISKLEFDHLHAHFFSQPSTIGFFVALLLGKPFSLSGHAKDVFDKNINSDSKPELLKEKIQYATFAVLCNKKAYDECIKYVEPDDRGKVHLLYHGVEILNGSFLIPEGPEVRIYYVGRFVQKKGLIYLLEAAKIMKERNFKFHLVLAGYGPDYSFLKNFVLSNDLTKYVDFINDNRGIDNLTSHEYMKHATLVVVPAINLDDGDSDGIPNIILEAGMLYKPVITTDAGSIKEIVEVNVNAILVEQKSEQQLAEAIINLASDYPKQKLLSDNLHDLVVKKFDLSKNIIQFEKLFEK